MTIPFINIHTHSSSAQSNTIELINLDSFSEASENKLYSIGLHPWNITNLKLEDSLTKLETFINRKSNIIAAIGEIGLDRKISTPIEKQIVFFEAQVQLANRLNLPIIIHCVRAWSDIIFLRKKFPQSTPWILHGMNANQTIAKQMVQNGIYLSFGINLLSIKKLQEVFKYIPFEWIFLETDTSSINISECYRVASILKGCSVHAFQIEIQSNFLKVFPKINL